MRGGTALASLPMASLIIHHGKPEQACESHYHSLLSSPACIWVRVEIGSVGVLEG